MPSWIHALCMGFWSSSRALDSGLPLICFSQKKCREGEGLPVPNLSLNRPWVLPFALLDLASPAKQLWTSLLEDERPCGGKSRPPEICSPQTPCQLTTNTWMSSDKFTQAWPRIATPPHRPIDTWTKTECLLTYATEVVVVFMQHYCGNK